ncbi:MAG: hypothetical protein H6733_07065 [Alphaproteobacteria bacterium]|nr:hypothetical protein [Alphaproteobacteria bacterium]
MKTAFPLVVAALLAGCATPDDADPIDTDTEATASEEADLMAFAADLAAPPPVSPPRVNGCSDMFVYGANVADTMALRVVANGLVAGATGTPETFTLPSTDVEVRFERGTDLTVDFCNDVFMGTTVVTATWVADGGTATITVTPTSAMEGYATVTLTDLVVRNTRTGVTHTLPEIVLADVYVGWLPG